MILQSLPNLLPEITKSLHLIEVSVLGSITALMTLGIRSERIYSKWYRPSLVTESELVD